MALATPTATWFNDDHRLYADSVGRFFADHLVPNIERWNEEEIVERNFWHQAGAAGILGATIPQTHGGAGGGIAFDAITAYEQARCGDNGWGFGIQSIVIGYVQAYATEEQKTRWLPQLASGEMVAALAMTEPGTGSDLQAVTTSAVKDGNHYRINGSKTFITNGQSADLICLVAKTDKKQGARGVSLIMVETDGLEGFRRGRNLKKAFGQRVMDFQNTRFKLAEIKTKIEVTRSFINDAITRLEAGTLDAATASMAKWWGSQMQCEVIDECLQLHGGYGYMMEYPIARLYTDARVQKIYGGTNEIMKELIARSMDL